MLSAVEEARRSVDRAVNDTIAALFSRDRSTRLTHAELIRLNRYPNPTAREIARAAEVYDRALSVIRRRVENGFQFNLSSKHKIWLPVEFSLLNFKSHLDVIGKVVM